MTGTQTNTVAQGEKQVVQSSGADLRGAYLKDGPSFGYRRFRRDSGYGVTPYEMEDIAVFMIEEGLYSFDLPTSKEGTKLALLWYPEDDSRCEARKGGVWLIKSGLCDFDLCPKIKRVL